MKYTGNYNLKKPEGSDTVNIDDLNDNFDVIDQALKNHEDDLATKETPAGAQAKADAAEAAAKQYTDQEVGEVAQALTAHLADYIHLPYSIADGTNNYTTLINGISSLVEGMSVKIKFTNANTGASTLNINGLGAIPIKKSNGNDLSEGNIKAGQILHLVYNGVNFQLLGEGGEYGNVTPDDVIKGVTFGTEEGLKTGTLELTGNAAAADVLSGKTFYSTNPKSKLTGTMPNHGSKTFTPSDSTQTGSAGYYSKIIVNPRPALSGNASTSDVLSGKTFYGSSYSKQTGTMTNRGAVTSTITTQGGSYTIPAGYHNGSGKVTANFANLIASNIRNGVTVGGVKGTLKTLDLSSLAELVNAKRIEVDGEETVTETFSSGYSLVIAYITFVNDGPEFSMAVRFNNKNLQLTKETVINNIVISNLTNESVTLANVSKYTKAVCLTVLGVN